VTSNNESKEFDIFVVVKGQPVNKTKLKFEMSDKLHSPRYLTRLFEPYFQQIFGPIKPLHFNEDSCSSLELFAFWFSQKEEGEWLPFHEIQPLIEEFAKAQVNTDV